jgi:hypothetical protein
VADAVGVGVGVGVGVVNFGVPSGRGCGALTYSLALALAALTLAPMAPLHWLQAAWLAARGQASFHRPEGHLSDKAVS